MEQGSAGYDQVELVRMSRKQTSFFLVDYARNNSLTLNSAAFDYDGKFFALASESQISSVLFGCTPDRCNSLLDLIRSSAGRNKQLEVSNPSLQDNTEQLQASFSAPYMDPNNAVNNFISYVNLCAATYRKYSREFYAPYITVVQTSGSGKSRLMRECAKVLPTLYVCYRAGNTGYPLLTRSAIYSLFEDPLGHRSNLNSCIVRMIERLRRAEISARTNLPRPGELGAGFNECKAEFPSELLPHVWDLENIDVNLPVPCSDNLVLLVLDEARWLLDCEDGLLFGLTRFQILLKALAQYWSEYPDARLFAVMVDTSYRIQNFALDRGLDHSSRQEMLQAKGQLFRPYIFRESFDVFFEKFKLPKNTRDLTPLLSARNHLLAGRPLVSIPTPDDHQQRLFLLRKLFGGATPDWENPSLGLGQLSLVLSRLATSIHHQSPSATHMVSGHMAHLLATDLSDEQMMISYLAEPRLASAAAMYWNELRLSSNLIPALQRALVAGTIEVQGEVVGQIILLIAFDRACALANKLPGEVVPLVRVLEQLLPVDSELNVLNAIPVSLRNASVSCGQIVQLAYSFDQYTNVMLAERHCGASLTNKQRDVDLIIPIIAKSPAIVLVQTRKYASQEEPCAASHSCCRAMLPSKALAGEKMSETELEELDENCVRIYMQLGAKKGHASYGPGAKILRNDTTAKPLQIFGLSSRCLEKDVRFSLQKLVNSEHNLDSFLLLSKQNMLKSTISHHPYPRVKKESLLFVTDNAAKMSNTELAEAVNWNLLTVCELKHACKMLGIRNYSRLTKSILVEKLDLEMKVQTKAAEELFQLFEKKCLDSNIEEL